MLSRNETPQVNPHFSEDRIPSVQIVLTKHSFHYSSENVNCPDLGTEKSTRSGVKTWRPLLRSIAQYDVILT
jgi:hypothetical protein